MGGGHYEDDVYLHTYQNGFCYEFHFFLQSSSRGNHENQCAYDDLDFEAVERLLMNSVSFFKTASPAATNVPVPAITNFTWSQADRTSPDRTWGVPAFMLSWSTRGADHVEIFPHPDVLKLLLRRKRAARSGVREPL